MPKPSSSYWGSYIKTLYSTMNTLWLKPYKTPKSPYVRVEGSMPRLRRQRAHFSGWPLRGMSGSPVTFGLGFGFFGLRVQTLCFRRRFGGLFGEFVLCYTRITCGLEADIVTTTLVTARCCRFLILTITGFSWQNVFFKIWCFLLWWRLFLEPFPS